MGSTLGPNLRGSGFKLHSDAYHIILDKNVTFTYFYQIYHYIKNESIQLV